MSFTIANSKIHRDDNLDNLQTAVNDRIPVYRTLPPRSSAMRGSIAYDETVEMIAYFDGLIWHYLGGGNGVTDIINIGGGAPIFETFNPNVPGNKVARLRSLTANQNKPVGKGNGILVTPGALTNDYSLVATIGDLTNVDIITNTPGANDILGYRGIWRNIGLVAGTGMDITHQATTSTIALDALIGELNNVDASADSAPLNEFLAVRTAPGQWRNIGFVAGSGISITHQLTTTTITATGSQVVESLHAQLGGAVTIPSGGSADLTGWTITPPYQVDTFGASGSFNLATGVFSVPALLPQTFYDVALNLVVDGEIAAGVYEMLVTMTFTGPAGGETLTYRFDEALVPTTFNFVVTVPMSGSSTFKFVIGNTLGPGDFDVTAALLSISKRN